MAGWQAGRRRTCWDLEDERLVEFRVVVVARRPDLGSSSCLAARQQEEVHLGVLSAAAVLGRYVARLVHRHRHAAARRLGCNIIPTVHPDHP